MDMFEVQAGVEGHEKVLRRAGRRQEGDPIVSGSVFREVGRVAGMVVDDPDDSGSTLVRAGKLAMGYKDMVAFVTDIEERPTARLVSDLEGLLALPEAKYHLVVIVLRKRTRPDIVDGPGLVGRMRYLQEHAEDPAVRSRALAFFEKHAS